MRTKVLHGRTIQYRKDIGKRSFDLYLNFLAECCRVRLPHASFYLSALQYIEQRDFTKLVELADVLSSQLYEDASMHFEAHQFSLLVRKYPWPKDLVSLDPEAEAVRKFLLSERKCALTNRLFKTLLRPWTKSPRISRDYIQRLDKMRSFIRYVLGDSVPQDVFSQSEFGPGSSIGVTGNATNRARKLLGRWTVTPRAYTMALNACGSHAQIRELLLLDPRHAPYHTVCEELFTERFHERCDVVNNNKITFVPKTAITHRAIAIEPLLNGYLQKGIDLVMRKRLQRVGVDLSNQQKNQQLARIGSVDGSCGYVTIDLSSASDTLATEVVRYLLPPSWFDLLNACRSHEGELPNKLGIRYEKFCSMGNGFCFPLESLIFASAVSAAGGKLGVDSLVYGDDIITTPAVAHELLRNLDLLGFKVNKRKTFLAGPFRESCGGDWFNGEDVRPFTLDYKFDSLESVFKTLNLTRRNMRTTSYFNWLTFDFFGVPQQLRFVRPFDGPPDTAVTVEWDVYRDSRFYSFNKRLWCHRWTELLSSSVPDLRIAHQIGYSIALLYGALQGVNPVAPFTLRRKSRTKVRQVSGSGASSNWVPAPRNSMS